MEHPYFFIFTKNTASLLQRDETRRVCSSNTRATVLDWLIGDGELTQVVATHLRLWKRKNSMLVTRQMHEFTTPEDQNTNIVVCLLIKYSDMIQILEIKSAKRSLVIKVALCINQTSNP